MLSPGDRPRLQIAIVAPSLKFLGGQAIQANRLLEGWRDDGEVTAWLVPHDPDPPRQLRSGLKVKYLRTAITESTYLPSLITQLARADVVHIFSASYWSFLLAPLPALVVARALGRPAVLHYHSGEAPDHLRRSAIARRALARTDATVVPSSYLKKVFDSFGLHAQVIPNIVDTERFRFSLRQPPGARILSTRNFEPLYNVGCTLRAFRVVQDARPDASLTLVGGGSQEAELRHLARSLQLENVTFAGRVTPKAIAEFYAAHDVYVQSPDIDNAPVSVLEAFASGLPVVSTEAGGVPAMVTSGTNGLLTAVNDFQALGEALLAVLDNPERARTLAEAGHRSVLDCTWPAVRTQWLALYRAMRARTTAQPVRDSEAGNAASSRAAESSVERERGAQAESGI